MLDDAELSDFEAAELRFVECSMRRVNFFNLACDDLIIENSQMQEARFDKADIREATLLGCEFTSAMFRDARLNLSRIENCDMSLVQSGRREPVRRGPDRLALPHGRFQPDADGERDD